MITGRVRLSGPSSTGAAIEALKGVEARINARLLVVVGAMAHLAYARCHEMLSLRDHTLAELAAMGHPYGRGLGREVVAGGGSREPIPHEPMEQVHARADELLDGLRETAPTAYGTGRLKAYPGQIVAQVKNDALPLDIWIQSGTRTMVARPYMRFVRIFFGPAIAAVGLRVAGEELRAALLSRA